MLALVVVLVILVVLWFAGAFKGLPPPLGQGPPLQPCPDGWKGAGLEADKCVSDGAQCSPAQFYKPGGLLGRDWGPEYANADALRAWAGRCQVTKWGGVL